MPGLRPAGPAAEQLQTQLQAAHRIASEVRHGDGVALVLISAGLGVWTDGDTWWWWTGHTTGRGRWIYNHSSTANVATAARRIALRYAELHGGEQSVLKERLG